MCKCGVYRQSLESPEINPVFLVLFSKYMKNGVNIRCVSAGCIGNHWKLSKSTPLFGVIFQIYENRGKQLMCKCGVYRQSLESPEINPVFLLLFSKY